jgi:hypothetical protein
LPAQSTLVAEVPMQLPEVTGRDADAAALGRGVSGFAEVFASLDPAAVVVLGDRIEAFAAASAASIGGRRVVHLHGGDRAEGVADDAMRHAITALSHLHLAATEESGARIRRLGEDPATVHVVGSPAVDGLDAIATLDDEMFAALGSPRTVVLHHGCGLDPAAESAWIDATLAAAVAHGPTVVLSPNADPGSDVVRDRIDAAVAAMASGSEAGIMRRDHLPRETFVALLQRIDAIVGNSSAGLIEAADLFVGCDTGPLHIAVAVGTPVVALFGAADPARDQSYFLFSTTPEQLAYLRFPLGGLASKAETRALAARHGLPVADKPDSQDICFVPNGNYADVILKLRPEAGEPGDIVDERGEILGQHRGIVHYTVGQRRGLGLSGNGEPLYVLAIDAAKRQVVAGPRESLAKRQVPLKDVNWLGEGPLADGLHVPVHVKIRSAKPAVAGELRVFDGEASVWLNEPENAISPGQACVFYAGEGPGSPVLGGGFIARRIA